MSIRTYVKITPENEELIYFRDIPLNITKKTKKMLGEILMDLIDYDPDELVNIYKNFLYDLIPYCIEQTTDCMDNIDKRFIDFNLSNPALWYYTSLIHLCYLEVLKCDNITIAKDLYSLNSTLDYLKKFEDHLNNVSNKKEKELIINYFDTIIYLIIDDLQDWKFVISYELERIRAHRFEDVFKNLSINQRLYYLENVNSLMDKIEEFKYSDYILNVCLIADTEQNSPESNENLGFFEVYTLNNIQDHIYFEFIKMILADLPIIYCHNCGRAFITHSSQEVKYCNRIAKNETRPCDVIGALRVYKNKISGKPIYKIYNTAYKRMSSRVKYALITQQDFRIWAEQARLQRDKCEKGEISLEEFNNLLGNKPLL